MRWQTLRAAHFSLDISEEERKDLIAQVQAKADELYKSDWMKAPQWSRMIENLQANKLTKSQVAMLGKIGYEPGDKLKGAESRSLRV